MGQSISLEVARHLIEMALANVLTNAFEAFAVDGTEMRPGSTDVTARTMLGRVELTIRDAGTGIAEQDLANPSFFLPERRRNTTKRHSTGYGLAIAMRNLSAHGGTLNVDSRQDEGTTVTIRLPLRETDEGLVL